MPLNKELGLLKGVETVWGKIISEKEAYMYAERHIAAFSANVFQVMRIFEPDFEKRTEAICSIAYDISMMADEGDRENFVRNYRDQYEVHPFIEQGSWLGGLAGDFGDECQLMSGRVIQFTPERVEKELDTCPWDIVGAEMCNMTTATFMAQFDLNSSDGEPNEMALDMCEARGCGDLHCRVVAERRDVYNREVQGPLDHFGQPVAPVTFTPREMMFKEGQTTRNSKYSSALGLEKDMSWCYHWSQENGWTWSITFPLMAIRDMAPSEEEFERVLKIVFSTAGKAAFIEPSSITGIRNWLGVPNEISCDDGRILGGYIKVILDTQLLPNELIKFDEEETVIKVKSTDFEGRFAALPIPELRTGYEAMWCNMAKTMVGAEWSCWFEDGEDEDMFIKVGKKIDKKMC